MKKETKKKLKKVYNPWAKKGREDADGMFACYSGALAMENNDKRKYKYNSINDAVAASNRFVHNIPRDKSSNITSNNQQGFCNKWKDDRGVKYTSDRPSLQVPTDKKTMKKKLIALIENDEVF